MTDTVGANGEGAGETLAGTCESGGERFVLAVGDIGGCVLKCPVVEPLGVRLRVPRPSDSGLGLDEPVTSITNEGWPEVLLTIEPDVDAGRLVICRLPLLGANRTLFVRTCCALGLGEIEPGLEDTEPPAVVDSHLPVESDACWWCLGVVNTCDILSPLWLASSLMVATCPVPGVLPPPTKFTTSSLPELRRLVGCTGREYLCAAGLTGLVGLLPLLIGGSAARMSGATPGK